MKDRNYFPFYYNWAELINEYIDEDEDEETARILAVAIIRYATRGEIRDLGNKHLQRMFEACLTSGIDAAAKHYDNGSRGGRPSKLTADDNVLIAHYRSEGQSAKQIATYFEVSDDTIRRSDGWQNPQKYTQNAKPYAPQKYTQPQNQEEEEEEKEKEEEKFAANSCIHSKVDKTGQNLPDKMSGQCPAPEKTGKNRAEENSGTLPEAEKTGGNLDIDIEIEKDIETETEKGQDPLDKWDEIAYGYLPPHLVPKIKTRNSS